MSPARGKICLLISTFLFFKVKKKTDEGRLEDKRTCTEHGRLPPYRCYDRICGEIGRLQSTSAQDILPPQTHRCSSHTIPTYLAACSSSTPSRRPSFQDYRSRQRLCLKTRHYCFLGLVFFAHPLSSFVTMSSQICFPWIPTLFAASCRSFLGDYSTVDSSHQKLLLQVLSGSHRVPNLLDVVKCIRPTSDFGLMRQMRLVVLRFPGLPSAQSL